MGTRPGLCLERGCLGVPCLYICEFVSLVSQPISLSYSLCRRNLVIGLSVVIFVVVVIFIVLLICCCCCGCLSCCNWSDKPVILVLLLYDWLYTSDMILLIVPGVHFLIGLISLVMFHLFCTVRSPSKIITILAVIHGDILVQIMSLNSSYIIALIIVSVK